MQFIIITFFVHAHTHALYTETNGLSPPPLGPKLCYGCKKPIEDDYRLSVSPDLEWHIDCLTCAECQQLLDESCTCFIKNGRPYCKNDYVRLVYIPARNILMYM